VPNNAKKLPARSGVVALAAVALAFLPVTEVRGAVAGIHDDLLVVEGIDVEARAALIETSGARVAKVDVRWSQIAPIRPRSQADPADLAYRFERLDAIVGSLTSRDITPLFSVYSTPRWAARSPAFSRASGAPRPGQFGRFMQALAHRYSGRYVDIQRGTIPRVRHYEIWNEPNNGRFLAPQRRGRRTVSLGAYVALAKAAYPRIKKVNPRAVVIAGSTAPRVSTNGSGVSSRDWLNGLARSPAKFDAYSMHLTSAKGPRIKGAPYTHWSSLRRIIDDLDSVERREGVPVYVTGAGYATGTSKFAKSGVTGARQAKYLRQIFALPVVRSERIPLVVWSNLQDSPARRTGLLSANGAEKSSFAKFLGEARRGRRLPKELRR